MRRRLPFAATDAFCGAAAILAAVAVVAVAGTHTIGAPTDPKTLAEASSGERPTSPPGAPAIDHQIEAVRRVAPELDAETLAEALRAVACARASRPAGMPSPKDSILAVVDYSLPSTDRRLWVLDLGRPALLFHELVAHGSGSGENLATRFSNEVGSKASSLGLYRTAEVYEGHHGRSLRLDGLTPGYNDHARERDIVMHDAWYVSHKHVSTFGRLGRSWGCPALDREVARSVIDTLRDGAWVFIGAGALEHERGELAAAVCASLRQHSIRSSDP